jgi:hypothetical protein
MIRRYRELVIVFIILLASRESSSFMTRSPTLPTREASST